MPPPVFPRRSTIKRVESLRWAMAVSNILARSMPTAPGNMVTFSQPIPSGSCEHKTGVARLQLGQGVLYLLLEIFITGALNDLVSLGFGQFLPICTVHAGIEMLPGHKVAHARINLLFHLRVETHWAPRGIGEPPSP